MYVSLVSSSIAPTSSQNERMWQAAQKLEAVFLAEMLKQAGFGQPIEGFGGGVGEDQFASLLVNHQAQALAKSGGVGLAEKIFKSMVDHTNE